MFAQSCSRSKGPKCIDGEVDYQQQSSLNIFVSTLPFTQTESRPAIPLITFVTGLLSTFGFWLGFSVSDFFHFAKNIWHQVQVGKDKLHSRGRLDQGLVVNQRILNALTRLQQVCFLLRRRLLKGNRIAQESAD